MKSIDPLSDEHVLALGKFIIGCERVRHSRRWRAAFAECARRNSFVPFVQLREVEVLLDLLASHGEQPIFRLKTRQILEAANAVAREWHEPPLVVEPTSSPVMARPA